MSAGVGIHAPLRARVKGCTGRGDLKAFRARAGTSYNKRYVYLYVGLSPGENKDHHVVRAGVGWRRTKREGVGRCLPDYIERIYLTASSVCEYDTNPSPSRVTRVRAETIGYGKLGIARLKP